MPAKCAAATLAPATPDAEKRRTGPEPRPLRGRSSRDQSVGAAPGVALNRDDTVERAGKTGGRARRAAATITAPPSSASAPWPGPGRDRPASCRRRTEQGPPRARPPSHRPRRPRLSSARRRRRPGSRSGHPGSPPAAPRHRRRTVVASAAPMSPGRRTLRRTSAGWSGRSGPSISATRITGHRPRGRSPGRRRHRPRPRHG